MSYNVRITFAVRITDGMATGIWASSVLSTYINLLGGGTQKANEKVGYAQAIQGTFLAAAAIPAGWLAIKYRRDSILKVMGLLAFTAIATTSAALMLPVHVPYKYGLLCCGLALWGVAQANAPVLDALFADSVPTGHRSKLYTWVHMCYIVSQGFGTAVGALIFALNGNVWKLRVLQDVMLVGMLLACVPAVLMMCFDDDKTLGAESEGWLLRAALLQGAEDEDEEAGPSCGGAGGAGGPEATPGGSPGDPSDYRRPFLDGWSSDVEREFRNQVSPLCSPGRPVLPASAAASVGANGIAYGNGYVPPPATYGNGYVPPPATAGDDAGGSSGGSGVGAGGEAATAAAAAAISPAGTAAAGPPADVSSHALLLTPTSMSPCSTATGLSRFVSPSDASPPPAGKAGAGAAGGGGGSTLGDGAAGAASAAKCLLQAVAAAAADESPDQAGTSPESESEAGGVAPKRPLDAAAAIVERFNAAWRDVDGAAAAQTSTVEAEAAVASTSGAATAAAAAAPSFADAPKASDAAPPLSQCRVVSIMGGVVPAIGVEENGGGRGSSSGVGGGGEGSEGGDGGSRATSISVESVPSELSFSSLPMQGSFKSALSRPFSRTGSCSSNGSVRDRSGSNGGSGPSALTLLPYPEEDPAAEVDVGYGASTPTLDPQADSGKTVRQAATAPLPPPPLPLDRPNTGSGVMKSEAQAGAPQGLLPAPLAAAAAAEAVTRARRPAGSGNDPAARLVADGAAPAGPAGSRISLQASTAASATAVRGPTAPGPPLLPPPQPPPRLVPRSSGASLRDRRFLCLSMACIPGILALTDCIMGLASGMTIKFFPIFFKDEVGLGPVYVSLIYCAIPLCLSAAAFMAQQQSLLLGRVQTMVMNRGIGICVLYWIALNTEHWQQPRLMVPIYVLRTSIMNSIYPLQKSILMDFVSKERRAAWNSLESVTSFGWSGSAALGGWLMFQYGFRVTFLVTAAMQSMGWAMSTLLLPIVPRKEKGLLEVSDKGPGQRGPRAAAPAAASRR